MYMNLHIYIYIRIYVSICKYIYAERDRDRAAINSDSTSVAPNSVHHYRSHSRIRILKYSAHTHLSVCIYSLTHTQIGLLQAYR